LKKSKKPKLSKLRVVFHADGRRGYPEVVMYRQDDGILVDLPPRDGSRYFFVIEDLDTFNDLSRRGMLGHGHSYMKAPEVFDDRRSTR